MLFDTHCHFELADPVVIRPILARAQAAGVTRLLAVGGSVALNAAAEVACELAREAVDLPKVACALGYDRDQLHAARPPVGACTAIGEIGLDYHYSPETRAEQCALFAEGLAEAQTRHVPVIVHTREAAADTAALLREAPSRGIIHCFTGTPAEAETYLELGFYISISGIVTFKAAENVRETARMIPDDRLLIETDAPFLAPVPKRGMPNESAFLCHTCEFLATLRGISAEELAALTSANAERILGADAEV